MKKGELRRGHPSREALRASRDRSTEFTEKSDPGRTHSREQRPVSSDQVARKRVTQDPPSQNEDGAPAFILLFLRFLNFELSTFNCSSPFSLRPLCELCDKPFSFFRLFLSFRLSTFDFELFPRIFNYSRTYAKQGGGGPLPQNAFACNSFVFFHHVNYFIN